MAQLWLQAEQEAKAAEEARKAAEAAAAKAEAEELARNPVARIRKCIAGGASPEVVMEEVKTCDAEGGQAGRTRILYEVRFPRLAVS